MFLKVRARELQPDDLCMGSQTRILSHPRSDMANPGRLSIRVMRKNGQIAYVSWNPGTTIGIERTAF